MPFFHRNTLISQELRKIALCGFPPCKLGRKGFHLELFWATPPYTTAEGRGESGQIVGLPKMPTWQNLFSPLLKINLVLLKIGMMALKTLIHKPVDQNFDVFLGNRDLAPGSLKKSEFMQFFDA